jgi:hypothetical protein
MHSTVELKEQKLDWLDVEQGEWVAHSPLTSEPLLYGFETVLRAMVALTDM